jgi:hypothetical protein
MARVPDDAPQRWTPDESVIAKHPEASPEQQLRAWLGPHAKLVVAVSCSHDQCYAHAVMFNVAGVGPTEDAAVQDLGRLLSAYLMHFYREGRGVEEAVHRAPARLRVRLLLSSAVARLSTAWLWRLPHKTRVDAAALTARHVPSLT